MHLNKRNWCRISSKWGARALERSLWKVYSTLGISKGKPSAGLQKLKKSQDDCGPVGQCYLDVDWKSIIPGRFAWGRGSKVERPKTFSENITKRIRRCMIQTCYSMIALQFRKAHLGQLHSLVVNAVSPYAEAQSTCSSREFDFHLATLCSISAPPSCPSWLVIKTTKAKENL